MKDNKEPVVVFIGQPNCGKSTLFNAIAGLKAETSNFPGTTVKHTHSKVNIAGRVLNIIDLPGTYSLNPADPAEKVVLSHIFLEKPDLIINVVDASILGRSLELTVELLELKYPMIFALNMIDLAEKKGIEISPEKLEKALGIPVVPTVATHGRGIKELLDKALLALEEKRPVPAPAWSRDVEEEIEKLEKQLPEDFPVVANKRFTAIKMIEARKLLFNEVLKEMNPPLKKALDEVRKELEEAHNAPEYEVISAERHHLAMKIFEESSRVYRGKRTTLEERVDDVLMHPILGYFILLVVFLGFFFIIFKIGNPLEELLIGPLESLRHWLRAGMGSGILFHLLDGLTQGIGGGVAIVLPFFLPLLFLMSFLEDLGYLARAGYLMDTFMHRLGIHGKSVAPFILGFGCNVPAVVSTRILESRRDRVITSLLIPFIPCAARTTIILALIAFYLGPFWALGFYVFNIFLVAVLGRIISLFFKTPAPGLILEIPSLKFPSLKGVIRKTYLQLKSFLKFAWPILIVGSIALGLLQFLGFDKTVNLILSPLVEKGLGLPQELGVTLIFGFLRKELSLIMMLQALGTSYSDLLTVVSKEQIIIFTVFISFFIPCLSTFAILWKEVGKAVAFISAALNTGVAILLSLAARLILRW
ncbi:MAG: ferrous iron transport protein B [Candidatus Aminicenantes bacterium]|nr:ferrous iron transport protein B [Candidatus Aminicenantes bacterium]